MYGVTTYPVIGEPLFEGATHDTDAAPLPATAVGAAGAPNSLAVAPTCTELITGVDKVSVVVRSARYCRYRPSWTLNAVPDTGAHAVQVVASLDVRT